MATSTYLEMYPQALVGSNPWLSVWQAQRCKPFGHSSSACLFSNRAVNCCKGYLKVSSRHGISKIERCSESGSNLSLPSQSIEIKRLQEKYSYFPHFQCLVGCTFEIVSMAQV